MSPREFSHDASRRLQIEVIYDEDLDAGAEVLLAVLKKPAPIVEPPDRPDDQEPLEAA